MNLIALDFNQGQNNARERYIIIAKDLRTPVFPFEFTIKHLRPKCCDMVLFIQVIYASESNIPVPVNYLPWKLCKPEVCSYASQNGPTNDVFDAKKRRNNQKWFSFHLSGASFTSLRAFSRRSSIFCLVPVINTF